jgi:hypothetical protein
MSNTGNARVAETPNRRGILCVVVPAFAVMLLVLWLNSEVRRTVSRVEDFAALWETHDLIQKHISVHGDAPGSWDELAPFFSEIDAGYGSLQLAYLQDRIDLNTDRSTVFTWAVRVRSGNQSAEERQANQQIGAALRARSNETQ